MVISILGIIYRSVFCLKHNILDIEFCFRLQMEPPQIGPVITAALSLSSSIYWAQRSRFGLKTETEPSDLNKIQNNG
jgi:hypothetical protein